MTTTEQKWTIEERDGEYQISDGHGIIGAFADKQDALTAIAAPDLLAACKLVLDSDMAQREEDEGRVSQEISAVRAVIAKAEGR